MPSVRGRDRIQVVAALVSSTLIGGVIVGFVIGASLAWLPAAFPTLENDRGVVILAALGAATVADAIWLATGRLRPWSINRQVPRQWGSLFPAPVTAALYGARIGVGPLTMLSTWLWWAFAIGGALLGPWSSLFLGLAFAATRVATTVATSIWAEGPNHQRRFQKLRQSQLRGRLSVTAAALGAALLLGACSSPAGPELARSTAGPTALQPGDEQTAARPASQSASSDRPTETNPTNETPIVTEPEATRITPADEHPTTSDPTQQPEPPQPEPPQPEPLQAVLIDSVPGFEAIDDPTADRSLDMAAAAAIQPDPTEELPLLETRGFSRGWTRAFRNSTRDVVVATVYEFVDETEAAFYLEDGLITIGGYGGQFFDIPDIEGGRGFRQELGGDEPLVSVGVTFARGNRWYLVYLIGDPQTATPETLIDAARSQADRVPPSS